VDQLVRYAERSLGEGYGRLRIFLLVLTLDGSGAMMNEIGLAQRRLLDDDSSTAGLHLPSTGTLCSTESVQSAPFPTIPTSHSSQMGPPEGDNSPYTVAPNGTHLDGNPSLLPNRRSIYDLAPLDATNAMAAFPKDVPTEPSMRNQNTDLNLFQNTLQPIAQQTGTFSPHDTEPMSSVASMRMSGPKTDTAGTSLIFPQQSQTSAHDELALPAIPPIAQPPAIAEPATAKKKRGRPKKQSLSNVDEDDELANSRDHEFKTPGANGAIDPSDSEEATENDTPASSGVSDETDDDNLGAAAKPGKTEAKESKKKRTKKAKATPAPNPFSGEEDVVWIDTKPLDGGSVKENVDTSTEPENPKTDSNAMVLDSNPSIPPQALEPTTANEKKTKSTDEKLAPKKRGRKRKQPAEHEETPEPNNLISQTPGPRLAVVVDNSPKSAGQEVGRTEPLVTKEQSSETPAPAPAPADDPLPLTTSAPKPPETPCKSDSASVNTPQNGGKGPNKHSPISARGGVPYRVGLSKRARIAPLLKMVRK
jgi:hypothetical protein